MIPYRKEKTAAFAPIPSPRQATAATVNRGDLRNDRSAILTSRSRSMRDSLIPLIYAMKYQPVALKDSIPSTNPGTASSL